MEEVLEKVDELIAYAKTYRFSPDPEVYEQIIYRLESLKEVLNEG